MTRVLLLAVLLALTGCSGTTAPASTVEPTPAAQPTSTLRIPTLGVDTSLQPLGRDDDGILIPPPVTEPGVAGWYADGVLPGEVGPALVAGHVSGRPADAPVSIPGVFARLAELHDGDQVTIDRDGRVLTFTVYRTGTYGKDAFPTGDVYANTDGPELRLVTCGGVFDPAAHSYEDNVVVFAKLAT